MRDSVVDLSRETMRVCVNCGFGAVEKRFPLTARTLCHVQNISVTYRGIVRSDSGSVKT